MHACTTTYQRKRTLQLSPLKKTEVLSLECPFTKQFRSQPRNFGHRGLLNENIINYVIIIL